jgi:nucleotide-binding universal stress UspA family protein
MPFKHVLVATDFSPCSSAAVEYAVDIASRCGAALTATHAFELPYSYFPTKPSVGEVVVAAEDAAEVQLARLLASIRGRVPQATSVVRRGAPWEQILEVARERGADLIVVGSHGRTGMPRLMLGSVAEKVVRLAPVPVLTVRGQPGERGEPGERDQSPAGAG